MRSIRLAIVAAALTAFLPGTDASAQTFPVTRGTLEFQLGFGAFTIPEDHDGAFSGQIEGRVGWFLGEGLEGALDLSFRVYPLGSQAPRASTVSVSLLWFPTLGDHRNLYLLAGAGGQYRDFPSRYGLTGGTEPIVRAGGGLKIPLTNSGIPYLRSGHLTVEYRAEWVWLSEAEVDPATGKKLDLTSGILVAYSYFL